MWAYPTFQQTIFKSNCKYYVIMCLFHSFQKSIFIVAYLRKGCSSFQWPRQVFPAIMWCKGQWPKPRGRAPQGRACCALWWGHKDGLSHFQSLTSFVIVAGATCACLRTLGGPGFTVRTYAHWPYLPQGDLLYCYWLLGIISNKKPHTVAWG